MKKTYESEDRLQQKCFVWFWNTYPKLRKLLFAVPNGGARSSREGALLKETGVVAGVSDMIFLYNQRAYCFELKTIVGRQSEKQEEWQKIVESQQVPYFIIRELSLFKNVIEAILKQ